MAGVIGKRGRPAIGGSQIAVVLRSDQLERIDQLAKESDASRAEMIRLVLDRGLAVD